MATFVLVSICYEKIHGPSGKGSIARNGLTKSKIEKGLQKCGLIQLHRQMNSPFLKIQTEHRQSWKSSINMVARNWS